VSNMQFWIQNSALIFFASVVVAMPRALAAQSFGGHNEAINLTAPIHIRDCVDGQAFSATVLKNYYLNLPKDTTLSGHLHIITPDHRASKNQRIELCFETLNLEGNHIPIVCRLDPRGAMLQVKRKNKAVSFPALYFRAPVLSSFDRICIMGINGEGMKKFERGREQARASDKESAIWNRRYGLESPNQVFFLSSKAAPFNLETSDKLWIRLDPPVDIPDYPARE
jgi:hypothetical protein